MDSTPKSQPELPPHATFPRSLPRWQVLLVLVGFPLLYWLNSFTPWSFGLFVSGNRDWYPAFLVSLLLLHWSTVLVMLHLVRRAGGTPRDIGLKANFVGVVLMLSLLLAIGSAMVALRPWTTLLYDRAPTQPPLVMYPATTLGSVLWMLCAVSAGFCEELIYRGFGIRVLQGRGMRTWLAVLLASLSFVMIHGVSAVFLFPFYFIAGLIFSGIFLWRKSLTLGICMHAMFDLLALWVVRVE